MSQTTDRPQSQQNRSHSRQAVGMTGAGVDLVVVNKPTSAVAEAYRSLRASIKFAGLLPPVRSILIGDAGTDGQHSAAAANLAAALAVGGDSVILVDANLRNPRLQQYFGLPNSDGLGEWLSSPSPEAAFPFQETGVPGLHLLSAGHVSGLIAGVSAADLLNDDRCSYLLERLRESAEFVILDAAPLTEAADALSLAARVDGVLLLIRSGRTKRVRAQRAKESLDRVGARLLGAVLTDAGRRTILG